MMLLLLTLPSLLERQANERIIMHLLAAILLPKQPTFIMYVAKEQQPKQRLAT